jgi:hypothetical protein
MQEGESQLFFSSLQKVDQVGGLVPSKLVGGRNKFNNVTSGCELFLLFFNQLYRLARFLIKDFKLSMKEMRVCPMCTKL